MSKLSALKSSSIDIAPPDLAAEGITFFGGDATGFIDGDGIAYARIEAARMFTFYLAPDAA